MLPERYSERPNRCCNVQAVCIKFPWLPRKSLLCYCALQVFSFCNCCTSCAMQSMPALDDDLPDGGSENLTVDGSVGCLVGQNPCNNINAGQKAYAGAMRPCHYLQLTPDACCKSLTATLAVLASARTRQPQ
jgi:hypothetical protein